MCHHSHLSAALRTRAHPMPQSSISFDRLRRYDGPGFFLGGGFVAGLLLFLVWLSMRPDHDRHSLHAHENGAGGDSALVAPGQGVLSGITGQGDSARPGAGISAGDAGAPDQDADAVQEQTPDETSDADQNDADSMAVGEDVGAAAQAEEGAALTDGLLGPPATAPAAAPATAAGASAPGAPLLTYYVEVEVAPGQVQILQLNAESPEHARAILRDFRGDPRVLRGPSTEPLQ